MTHHCVETISDVSTKIRKGQTSSGRVVRDYLDRIQAHNGYYHAFKEVFADEALEQALALDAELKEGNWRGPLHGVPLAIKDNLDLAGKNTSGGSMTRRGTVAADTSPVVARLIEAGAIIVGKTHMVEFAFGGWGTNTAMGTPRNPLDDKIFRVPGGSSSGSGVAVAAGLVPAAIGTDTGGSVRIPAAMNGLAGFKPTWGRFSDEGLVPLSKLLDVIGPLARDVADCWTIFNAMSGKAQDGKPLMPPAAADPSGLRIGVADLDAFGEASEDVRKAYATFQSRLSDAGAKLIPFRLPMTSAEAVRRSGTIIGFEASTYYGDLARDQYELMDKGARERIIAAGSISRADFIRQIAGRKGEIAAMKERFSEFECFVFPTTPIVAAPLSEITEAAMPLGNFTRVVNYLDLCALTLPVASDQNGLPISMQIIGSGGADNRVFEISAFVEKLVGTRKRI
ncbi:amidase [Nitratireductor indicus]|uniref:amidase n=1 Tax=Nitratireductor indicus TaxID=721133 RepID=UPI002876755D|nr:amidase [Nitratireductor indicus]MDS1135146.1 amidase [Nitratireductor indicus]